MIKLNDNELFTLNYLMSCLASLVRQDFEDTKDMKREIKAIIKECNEQIDNQTNDNLTKYTHDLAIIASDMKYKLEVNEQRLKPIKIDCKPYYEQAYNKLLYLFRKEKILTTEEANVLYSNYDYLNSKYQIFLDLIDWLNSKSLSIIINRLLFCSYLGINENQFEDFLNSEDERVSSIFKSIDNMSIDQKMVASEIGTRNATAIRTNLSYDKVSNGLKPNDNNSDQIIEKTLSSIEIMKKLKTLGYSGNDVIDVDYTEK